MADLSSILGGMVQGFKDFGTGLVDMFGTGGAAIGDLFQSGGRSTKNQDDFRKWLYQTDNTQDAAAKGLGTILNGVQTVSDFIPGAGAVTRNPLFNGVQGAIGGVADEFKMAGKDYDLGRAAQRAGVGAASGLASAYTNQALGKTGNKLINNGLVRGAAGGALAGGIANAGYTGIEGGSVQDMINAGLYGAQTGALVGGTTGLARELIKPNHKMDVALTDDERRARIANIDDQLAKLDTSTQEGIDRHNELMMARIKYEQPQDYMMSHRPTRSGIYADDLLAEGEDGLSYPKDVYDKPQNYTFMYTDTPDVMNETMAQLNAVRGNPNGEVTIYRATPGNTINDGDWITLSESYAKHHNDTQLDGKGNVLSQKVNVRDIQPAMDDLAEWGYFPQKKAPTNVADLMAESKQKTVADPAQPDYLGDEKYSKLVEKAKNYKTLDRFEKMNNPIKGSEIWGEKPKSYFERDSRAVRINMFPNDAAKGTGLTKQYLLNMFKDAYDDGITNIVPSYGLYTKEGASFMNHLADQGWVKQNGGNGYNSYEIAPKIAEWKKTSPLADIYNAANNLGGKPKTVADLMLSPEQEEFFKGSKLRDENGKLMRVYHSSPNEFTTFDDSKLGSNTAYDNTAFGHFVTSDEDFSRRFRNIDGNTDEGYTMELYANAKKPITHPYEAAYKYSGDELDNIVKNYYKETDNPEALAAIKEWADESGQSLYDAYMDMSVDENPFEMAAAERKALQGKGYDAVEFVEGRKSGLVDGSNDDTPVSSYAIFSGNQLKDVNNLKPTADADIMYSKVAEGQTSAASSSDGKYKRIGSADVAPINPETLPDSLRMANEYINEGYIKDIEKTMGKPYSKMTDNDFLEYSLRNKKPEDRELFKQIINDMVKDGSTTYEKYAKSAAGNKYLRNLADTKLTDMDSDSLMRYLINNKNKLTDNFTKAADAELSDRLGIGRSNTLMMDNSIGTENAYGVYNPTNSTMSLNTRALGEGDAKTNVAGHERLHSFQTEARIKRYSPEVVDAYKDLRKELRAANAFKNKQEIKDYWGEDIGYYHNNDEQEARMFQQYLEKKGFTDRAPKSSNKVYHEKNVREFDNNKITPAFDKFLDKLRALSKKGVALPALTALFGGGAIAGALTSGKDDKKKKSEVK